MKHRRPSVQIDIPANASGRGRLQLTVRATITEIAIDPSQANDWLALSDLLLAPVPAEHQLQAAQA